MSSAYAFNVPVGRVTLLSLVTNTAGTISDVSGSGVVVASEEITIPLPGGSTTGVWAIAVTATLPNAKSPYNATLTWTNPLTGKSTTATLSVNVTLS